MSSETPAEPSAHHVDAAKGPASSPSGAASGAAELTARVTNGHVPGHAGMEVGHADESREHAVPTAPLGAPVASAVQSKRQRQALSGLVRVIQLGPVLVLAVLWVAMTFLSPYFLTTLNFSDLMQAAAIPAVLALGQLLVILTGGIDLSAGAVYVLVAVIGAKFAQGATFNPIAVMSVMLGVGLLCGLINGVLIEYVRIGSAFVVTLGTLSVVTGAAYIVSNGGTLIGLPKLIDQIGGGYFGQVPIDAVIVAGLAVILSAVTMRMRWGRWVYAIGSNREGAERVGIRTRPVIVSVFACSGLAAGVAGIFEAGLANGASSTISFTSELDAISAVVVGGAALTGGRGTVWGTMVGALILETITNGLNILNVNTNWEPIVLGLVLLTAVGLERARSQLETRVRLVGARLAGDL